MSGLDTVEAFFGKHLAGGGDQVIAVSGRYDADDPTPYYVIPESEFLDFQTNGIDVMHKQLVAWGGTFADPTGATQLEGFTRSQAQDAVLDFIALYRSTEPADAAPKDRTWAWLAWLLLAGVATYAVIKAKS